MPRKTKDETIASLQEQLEQYKGWLQESFKKNWELLQTADEAFANSVDKRQLEQERDFYKTLEGLSSTHYASAKANMSKQKETIRKLYEDNKALANAKDMEYTVGMCKTLDTTKEQFAWTDLVEENQRLKAKMEARDEKILFLMEEIKCLQTEIATNQF